MSDHDQPVAANLLDRQFTAAAPNERWAGDTTEFVIGESGKLYLAAILDLFSRFVVGWAVSAVNDRHLTIRALETALKRRGPEAGLLHHSDQGCTYASEDYQRLLDTRGITCSMSRRGDCYDNAVMVEFHIATCGPSRGKAPSRPSHLGGLSPEQFEAAHKPRRESPPNHTSEGTVPQSLRLMNIVNSRIPRLSTQ